MKLSVHPQSFQTDKNTLRKWIRIILQALSKLNLVRSQFVRTFIILLMLTRLIEWMDCARNRWNDACVLLMELTVQYGKRIPDLLHGTVIN